MIYFCAVLESTTEVIDATETRTTEISTTESITTDESTTEGIINLRMDNVSLSLHSNIVFYIKIVNYFARVID